MTGLNGRLDTARLCNCAGSVTMSLVEIWPRSGR